MKYNPPIGIDDKDLPFEVKKVLSVGGGFVLKTPLKLCLDDTVYQLVSRLSTGPKRIDQSFVQRVRGKAEREIDNLDIDRPSSLHLTLMRGIKYIKAKGWVVKQSDKNLGLTLMSRDVYDGLVHKELHGDAFSSENQFPYDSLREHVKSLLEKSSKDKSFMEEILDYANGAKKPAPFYVLPKIHKPTLKSRPITASHSYITADLSRRLSSILNNEVAKIPAITVNSWQIVRQLEHLHLPTDCIFLTYDVERCYPSIDVKEAIRLLVSRLPQIFMVDNGFWCRVLQFIMYKNFVTDGKEIFKQEMGTATGTAVAPAFANLYLFHKFRRIFLGFASSVILNRRYIDDGFVILRNRNAAHMLMERLNNCSNLNLTWEISDRKAVYLDLEIYKGQRFFLKNVVDLRIFTKPISKFLYLHGKSFHPVHTFTGIVKGEMIRYLRNTSDEKTWKTKVAFLFRMLAQRGYTGKYLRTAMDYVSYSDRAKFLEKRDRPEPDIGAFIKCLYHPQIRTYWRHLENLIVSQIPRAGLRVNWPRTLIFLRGNTVRRNVISAIPYMKSSNFSRCTKRQTRRSARIMKRRQVQLYKRYWKRVWNQRQASNQSN